MAITDRVEEIITPAIESLGYELVGVEYIRGGPSPILRIYIDTEQGVNVDDCEQVSRQVSAVLDVEDPINSAYMLEVSSPGFDRPLFKARDFKRFAGEQAKITTKLPINGRRNFTGELQGMDGDSVLIEVDGEVFTLPVSKLAKARLMG